MKIGDFGNFGGWSPKDHALSKMVYDEAHKKGGGLNGGGSNNNTGCAVVFVIVIAVILALVFG